MYISLPDIKTPSKHPWVLTLAERQTMLAQGKYKIAYYYEESNDSSFRYRAYNMCEAINLSQVNNNLAASFFFRNDYKIFNWLSKTADLLVICRSGHDDVLCELVQLFKERLKTIIFDVDDLVIDPAYCKSVAVALGEDYGKVEVADNWHKYFSRLRSAALLCDAICSPNRYLSNLASKSLGIPGLVIPNSLNSGQVEVSTTIFKAKEKNNYTRNDKFTLGYFSGTRTHRNDFAIISESLARLMANNSAIELLVCGYLDMDSKLAGFKERIRFEPFRDYISLQRLTGECEIALAPLKYSTFTNCKSDLKFFEPAAVGTACIASPTYSFIASIRNGIDGVICQRHRWFSVLSDLSANPLEVARISKRSYATALVNYTPKSTFSHIINAFSLLAHANQ